MTEKKIIYIGLEALFLIIAPLVLILIEYGNMGNTAEEVGFKLSLLGIVLVLLVFVLVKKIFINKWLNKLTGLVIRYEGDVAVKVNGAERDNAVKQLKRTRTLEAVFNAVTPILVLALALVMCKGLEGSVVKLSGVVGFILISFVLGTIFSILAAREVKDKL